MRVFALIAYALLLLIHFVLKDNFHFLQLVFYAFPLPILIFIGSFLTVFYLFRPRTYLIDIIAMMVILTAIWLKNSYVFSNTTDVIPASATSVLFWNAADGHDLPVRVLIENIDKLQPDVIGLVEATNATAEDILKLSTAFPEYDFRILEGGMLVGVKGHIAEISYMGEDQNYDINIVEAQVDNGFFTIAITDTFQDPGMDKRKTLGTVLELVSQKNTDIMVGDFNTPYESVHFRDYKKEYTSMRNFGQGFTATWLFGFPILEIDQIFVNKKFRPITLKKFQNRASDHAILVGYFGQ